MSDRAPLNEAMGESRWKVSQGVLGTHGGKVAFLFAFNARDAIEKYKYKYPIRELPDSTIVAEQLAG